MKSIIFFTFLLSMGLLQAQNVLELKAPSSATCATTPATLEQRAEIAAMIQALKHGKTENTGTTCIPMKAHIIQNAANVPAVSILDMNKALTYLNYFYFAANLEFYWCDIAYITSDDYYTFDGQSPDNDTEASLVTLPGIVEINTAINVYFVNSITLSSGFNACGYAYFPCNSVQCTRILMAGGCTAGDPNGTMTHELGHFFGLSHTFEGTSNGNTDPNAENVARTGGCANCATHGDDVCDTPADPNGTVSNCIYTGGATDICGQTYTPDTWNIMSYYPNNCGGVNYPFTPEQYTRIAAAKVLRQSHTAYNFNYVPTNVPTPTGLTATFNTITNKVDLTWTDNASGANNDRGYLIERSTISNQSGFVALIDGATNTDVATFSDSYNLVSFTTYYYRVKPANGACNNYSNVVQVSIPLNYCYPTYSNGCASNVYIDRVHFYIGATTYLNNATSGCTGALANHTNITFNATAGTTYTAAFYPHLFGGGSYYPQYFSVWIDINTDGDFDDAGEKVYQSTTTGYPLIGSFTIPAICAGDTRLRVRSSGSGQVTSPCNNLSWGEAEDYTLHVVGNAPTSVTVCPRVSLLAESTAGKGNDRSSWSCGNYTGNDICYKLYAPPSTSAIKVSVENASAPVEIIWAGNSCSTTTCVDSDNSSTAPCQMNFATGGSSGPFYVWIDHNNASDVTYDISFGAVTGSMAVNIPDTRGNWEYDNSICQTNLFKNNYKVFWDNVAQSYPLTLSPLNTTKTLCTRVFLKNPTGNEGLAIAKFVFGSDLLNPIASPATMPGFYNAGTWYSSVSTGGGVDTLVWTFVDAANTGRGDYDGSPSVCLAYDFCVNLSAASNNPLNTNVTFTIIGDGEGSPINGTINLGCCSKAPQVSCCIDMGGNDFRIRKVLTGNFNDPNNVFPIELVNFKGNVQGKEIVLDWKTLIESNMNHFGIEKKGENQFFEEIGRQSAHNQGNQMQDYQYIDPNPLMGKNFYRLNMLDENGYSQYSETIEVTFNEIDFRIYPNPTKEKLFLKLPFAPNQGFRIKIKDVRGCDIMNLQATYPKEGTAFELKEAAKLSSGLYLIQVIDDENGKSYSQKVQIQ